MKVSEREKDTDMTDSERLYFIVKSVRRSVRWFRSSLYGDQEPKISEDQESETSSKTNPNNQSDPGLFWSLNWDCDTRQYDHKPPDRVKTRCATRHNVDTYWPFTASCCSWREKSFTSCVVEPSLLKARLGFNAD